MDLSADTDRLDELMRAECKESMCPATSWGLYRLARAIEQAVRPESYAGMVNRSLEIAEARAARNAAASAL